MPENDEKPSEESKDWIARVIGAPSDFSPESQLKGLVEGLKMFSNPTIGLRSLVGYNLQEGIITKESAEELFACLDKVDEPADSNRRNKKEPIMK